MTVTIGPLVLRANLRDHLEAFAQLCCPEIPLLDTTRGDSDSSADKGNHGSPGALDQTGAFSARITFRQPQIVGAGYSKLKLDVVLWPWQN